MLRIMLAATLVTLATTTANARADATVWTGEAVVEELQTGRLSLDGATIKGDIDFRGIDLVASPFSCRNCVIDGRILADDVVFGAALDLSGAEISKAVLMRRATFRGPVLFGPTSGVAGRSSVFKLRADFSLSTFADLASFLKASFAGSADFTTARFREASVFAGSIFKRDAAFERTVFSGGADFRRSVFEAPARFEAAQFDRRADFSFATFSAETSFEEARFGRDATFLASQFTSGDGKTFDVTFGGATGERDLVFDLAQFNGRAIFRQTVAGRVLTFDEALLSMPKDRPMVFDRVTAEGISMDVNDSQAVVQPTDRERVLELIEAGAKGRGDLGVANDARFSLEVLKSRDEPWTRRLLNVFFYRLIAGYFVRPLHPIVALVVLIAVVSLFRVLSTGGSLRRLSVGTRRVGHEFLEGLALIVPGGDVGDRGSRRLEAVVYRVLVVCALIGLANSNPTLREMFDALV